MILGTKTRDNKPSEPAVATDKRSIVGGGEGDGDAADREEMERLAQGHENALGPLMDRHGQKLLNYLMRSLQNEEDAADLAQETFVRVFQNRNRFDSKQRFSTWLYAIASNLVKDRFRWRTRHPQVSMDVEGNEGQQSMRETLPDQKGSPSEAIEQEERSEKVRRAVAELPEEMRLPVILAEYEGKSQAEIAEILGCSVKAVETRIYRARQRLRACLSDLIVPGRE